MVRHGSPQIVTLSCKGPVELSGKPFKTRTFLLGKGIALTIETVKGVGTTVPLPPPTATPRMGAVESHEDEPNV